MFKILHRCIINRLIRIRSLLKLRFDDLICLFFYSRLFLFRHFRMQRLVQLLYAVTDRLCAVMECIAPRLQCPGTIVQRMDPFCQLRRPVRIGADPGCQCADPVRKSTHTFVERIQTVRQFSAAVFQPVHRI